MQYTKETIKGVVFEHAGILYKVSDDGKQLIYNDGSIYDPSPSDIESWIRHLNSGVYKAQKRKEDDYAIY